MTFKLLELNPGRIVVRFYLMMFVVIAAGFSGVWPLALLAVPILFSALMGVSIRTNAKTKDAAKQINLAKEPKEVRKAS